MPIFRSRGLKALPGMPFAAYPAGVNVSICVKTKSTILIAVLMRILKRDNKKYYCAFANCENISRSAKLDVLWTMSGKTALAAHVVGDKNNVGGTCRGGGMYFASTPRM